MYLFVYGTLKSNFDNEVAQYLHSNAKLVGKGSIYGRLYLLGWYPGYSQDDQGYEINGEVYEITGNSAELLSKLDEYEGVDIGEYRRVLKPIWSGKKKYSCWVYETLITSEIELTSGVFLASSN